MSVVVDALGKQCPIPVVMAKKALAELQTPDTLEILVDNEAAVQNLSKLAASCQLPVRAEKTGEKRFSVTMEVSAPVQPAEETACAPDARGDLVVAVGSNCMGNGEEALGKTLMKGFCTPSASCLHCLRPSCSIIPAHTLPARGPILWRI